MQLSVIVAHSTHEWAIMHSMYVVYASCIATFFEPMKYVVESSEQQVSSIVDTVS